MTMDFHGLRIHCPALLLYLQDLYDDVFGKTPGNRGIVYWSDLLSTYSCSILCRRSVKWFIQSWSEWLLKGIQS